MKKLCMILPLCSYEIFVAGKKHLNDQLFLTENNIIINLKMFPRSFKKIPMFIKTIENILEQMLRF